MAFMQFGAITTGVQTVTVTGPVNPTAGLSISNVTPGNWTCKLTFVSLTPGCTAQVQLETSTDGVNWTAFMVQDVKGGFGMPPNDRIFTRTQTESPDAPFGTAGAKVRANVTALVGLNASLVLRAWVEY